VPQYDVQYGEQLAYAGHQHYFLERTGGSAKRLVLSPGPRRLPGLVGMQAVANMPLTVQPSRNHAATPLGPSRQAQDAPGSRDARRGLAHEQTVMIELAKFTSGDVLR